MKPVWIGVALLAVIVVALVMLVRHISVERYQIVHAAFIAGTNAVALPAPGVVCYSSQELRQAVKATNILEQAGMTAFDLDAPDLTGILASNHVVEEVLGKGEIGFIHVKPSPTNGVSFTVIKGKKRLLQIAIAPDR